MKQVPVYLFLFLLGLSCPLLLKGQTLSLDPSTNQAFNNYVKYVNQNIHTLAYFHDKFKRFNLKLNHYYSTYPSTAEARIEKEQKTGALVFTDSISSMSLSSLYEQTISTSKLLKAKHQVELNASVEVMMKLIFKLVNLNASLDKYVKNKRYLEEPDLSTAYDILNQVRLSFYEFGLARDELEFQLQNTYRQYRFDEHKDEVWTLQQQLIQLLVSHQQLVQSLKKADHKELEQRLATLKQLKLRLPSAKKMLKEIRQTNKPKWRALYDDYTYFQQKSDNCLVLAEQYLTDKESGKMKIMGKTYVYYNDYALNQYNQLIYAYDEWLDVSGIKSLAKMEEVPWFEPVIPPSATLDGAAPNNLIFLLDVSSSMNKPERLPLLQESLKRLIKQLRPSDRIAIVTYSGKAKVVLPSTPASELKKITRAIDNLKSNGESHAFTGLQMAYRTLDEHFIRKGNNRIILATDGYFQAGSHFSKLIQEQAFLEKRLSIFYLGDNPIRFQNKLQNLANLGKGNYTHIRPENVDQMLIKEAKVIGDSF